MVSFIKKKFSRKFEKNGPQILYKKTLFENRRKKGTKFYKKKIVLKVWKNGLQICIRKLARKFEKKNKETKKNQICKKTNLTNIREYAPES